MESPGFIRYGLLRRIRRGIRLTLVIIHKCNLNCSYCIWKIPNNEMPWLSYSPMTLEKMKNIIVDFPLRISEISITGGEPTLNQDFPDMVNWLLSQGICVVVYSNLTFIGPFLNIKRTRKFRIVATYHSCFNKDKFMQNYESIKEYYRIDVFELREKTLSVSKLNPFATIKDTQVKLKSWLRIGIDGLIFQSCGDFFNHYTKTKQ